MFKASSSSREILGIQRSVEKNRNFRDLLHSMVVHVGLFGHDGTGKEWGFQALANNLKRLNGESAKL